MTETLGTETSPASSPFSPAYHRVLLKLSGEVFGGGKLGVDPDVVNSIAKQIADVARSGVQVAVVVGGGNFFRGAELQQRGMERNRADYMGMLGTVMNCLALQDFLEKLGIETRVQTAITMGQVAEPYIPRKAERHLEKGRVVIFGAGSGMPYFSTDTVAAQRALEIGAEALLMGKQGVDGVYSADPHKHPDAVKFDQLSYDDFLARGLRVADATAISLARDNALPIVIFGLEEGNIARVVHGEKIGIQTRVQTAIAMGQVAEPYIPRRAERHLEKGRVVIFGAGSGMPYFSTDTVAAQRALEISAEVLLMGKQGVDGVYSADPHKHPDAIKFDDLTYDEYLSRNLKVADATAISMARDYKLPMIFFSLDTDGTIVKVVAGERIGTTVHA